MSSKDGKKQDTHPPISMGEIHEIYKLHLAEYKFKNEVIKADKLKILQEGKNFSDKGRELQAQAEEGPEGTPATLQLLNSARTNFQKAVFCFERCNELQEIQLDRSNRNLEIAHNMAREELYLNFKQ